MLRIVQFVNGLRPSWFAGIRDALTSLHVFAMALRSCDVAFKLKAFAAVEGGNMQAAARQFKTDAKRVKEWCLAAKTSSSPTSCRRAWWPLITLENERVVDDKNSDLKIVCARLMNHDRMLMNKRRS